MPQSALGFAELLASARYSAVHLEMRDVYAVREEQESFAAWRRGQRLDPADRASWWRPWLDLVSETVGRRVVIRRARIVSEPVTDYIRYEHSGTFTNIAAGEQVRWLPRRKASTIALPGNDFWLIDDRAVRFNHFSGNGVAMEPEMSTDPDAVRLCASAFDAVWELGTPHEQYSL